MRMMGDRGLEDKKKSTALPSAEDTQMESDRTGTLIAEDAQEELAEAVNSGKAGRKRARFMWKSTKSEKCKKNSWARQLEKSSDAARKSKTPGYAALHSEG